MKKTKLFKLFLTVTALIIITIIIFQILISRSSPTDINQTNLPPARKTAVQYPDQITTFKNVNLTETDININDFITQYGQPRPKDPNYPSEKNKNLYFFSSSTPYVYTEINTDESGNITAIKERDITKESHGTLNDYLTFYQKPDLELYGPWHESNYKSYIWLQAGLIIVANPQLSPNDIIEIWRISPLTKSAFMSKYTNTFYTTPPTPFPGAY